MAAPLWLLKWWKLGVGVILGALLCYPVARCDGVRDGKRIERAAWELQVARLKAEAERLQRIADQLRQAAEQADRARIERNRQEIDNALRDIADQATSARQRARACIELRRQGQNPPACQSQPAARPAQPPR